MRPPTLGLQDPKSDAMFEGLVQSVRELPNVGEATIDVAHIAVDDIWTYDRAPGRRIVFPWHAEGLPGGTVQMDMVFGEELWSVPTEMALSLPGKRTVFLWSAGKEVSLAWKLLWLETDGYPQGKDLYDATLLAEQTRLPLSLLLKVLQTGDWHSNTELTPDFPLKWHVDWETFQREYPWVQGEAEDWQLRLTVALAPTFI